MMTRMRQADGFSLDYEVGRLQCIVLGGFRPLVGAVFGTVAYFALQSGFININPPKGDELFYFALISFLAGFSERFAQVILGGAELSVAKEPNELVAPVHDRMPVILPADAEVVWLDQSISKEHALSLLETYPATLMLALPASTRTNSVRNDDSGLLLPDDALAA